ncbi:UDP-N-acetylmuramoyl-tripeptide--D-alanyl-D-alanine ligase [Dissulfurispira thermophila]|uniref:UDP-N-acetylmuramoyl-tripeptide--D-alanyl-D-alanine ligase n=1 Tax=Dissulfurispira thermophila TaxID=2715679 RepID=A0A7G1H143_9BACT|nr:UDP-N-acetylmuramoyl-tripeptide--D-alanyl-D-alanine ligase [Dissulfurispira thermophila]BCB95853.1 UDP-N-acetylmuramoyl-tripeptide--D-alanyl-D-alanine ligase [Dissulfurispira thermophila]
MLNIGDIIKATGGSIVVKGDAEFTGISIDSRTIKDGELFIALKGDRFDGHNFTMDALKSGAGAIVSNLQFIAQDVVANNRTIILVDNTLLALHNLARYMRKKFKGHVIGVVGSNGKTTTKELISSILSIRLNVLKTSGNLNNHIGMPLSITRMNKNTHIMVLEMGTNMPGDVDELCSIALPDIGVITNIGYEHLQGFGSLHKVRDAELEIAPFVKKLVVNADDLFLMEGVVKKFKGEIITFAIDVEGADITVRDIVFSDEYTKFLLCAKSEYIDINLKIHGRFNIYNSIAAAATAYAVGFNLQEIKNGLESFEGVNMRFEIKKARGVTFLNDVYNANPSSMQEAINELVRLINSGKYRRAIAVLGDMLELGDYGVSEHKKLGQRLSVIPVDTFIGVGPLMSFAVSEFVGKGISVDTSDDAGIKLGEIIQEGDIVLIKGSRGMRMERVIAAVEDSEEAIGLLQQNRS